MNRKTGIAIGVLLVLIVAYVALREDKVRVGVQELTLPSFTADKIDEISIAGNNLADLVKKEGKWFVLLKKEGEQPRTVAVDPKAVELMLTSIQQIQPGYFVSALPEKQAEFGVGDAQGNRVQLKSNSKVVWDLLVGNHVKGGRYVRLPPNQDVFVASGNFYAIIKNSVNDWRQHNLTSVSADYLRKLVLSDQRLGQIVLERSDKDKPWTVTNASILPPDFRYDSEKANQIARSIAGLKASSFVDDKEKVQATQASLSSMSHRVEAYDEKGNVYRIQLGDKHEDGKAPAQVEGDAQLYEVPGYLVNQLGSGLESIRNLSVFQFSPESIRSVVLKSPKAFAKLDKKEEQWVVSQPKTLPAGFQLDQQRITNWLNRLKSQQAVKITSDALKKLAQTGPYIIELTDDKGSVHRVQMSRPLPQKDASVPREVVAVSSLDKHAYIMNGYDAEQLDEGIKLFEKITPPTGNAGGVQGIESLPPDVQRQLMKAMQQRG